MNILRNKELFGPPDGKFTALEIDDDDEELIDDLPF
jgi:hypothetical protein